MELTLHARSWGTGDQPLVLLHGFTGSASSWDHLEPLLGSRRRVIAVDLPGHGRSALPAATGREGFAQTLEALARLLEVQAPDGFDLLGYSQGARVALGLAVEHPLRVRRLVLESVNPGLKRSHDRAIRRAEDEAQARLLERNGVDAFMQRWEGLSLFAGLRCLPEPTRSALAQRRRACSAPGLAGALRSIGLGAQPSYWSTLPMLSVPTLLLTGAEDRRFTELARRAAAELPRGWRHAFAGAAHAPHLEVPVPYADEVSSFLAAPELSVVERAGT